MKIEIQKVERVVIGADKFNVYSAYEYLMKNGFLIKETTQSASYQHRDERVVVGEKIVDSKNDIIYNDGTLMSVAAQKEKDINLEAAKKRAAVLDTPEALVEWLKAQKDDHVLFVWEYAKEDRFERNTPIMKFLDTATVEYAPKLKGVEFFDPETFSKNHELVFEGGIRLPLQDWANQLENAFGEMLNDIGKNHPRNIPPKTDVTVGGVKELLRKIGLGVMLESDGVNQNAG